MYRGHMSDRRPRYDVWHDETWRLFRANGSYATVEYRQGSYHWSVVARRPSGSPTGSCFTGSGTAPSLEQAKADAERAMANRGVASQAQAEVEAKRTHDSLDDEFEDAKHTR